MPDSSAMAAVAPAEPRVRTTHTPDGQYRFDLGETGMLGSGAHGVVRLASHIKTSEMVAVKVMPANMMANVTKELLAHGRVRHPHIVRLESTQVDLDRKRVYMTMELCRGGELFDRIAECGKLEETSCRRALFQMASALAHCHERNIFHRDLKPENILLDHFDNVKVADFGLAAMMKEVRGGTGFLRHTKCGSLMYAAPEVLLSSEDMGYDAGKADVWSLGVIAYAMLTGALPFQVALEAKCKRFAFIAEHGLLPLCEANGFSEELSQLLCSMLQVDPSRRADISQVLAAPWLAPEGPVPTPPATPTPTAPETPASMPTVLKWSKSLGDKNAQVAASSGDKRDWEGKRKSSGEVKGEVTAAAASTGEEEEEEPESGVNGMLVRSLGWVQLPTEKERLMQDVTETLESMGAKYQVVKGELTDVVTATIGAPEGGSAPEDGVTEGQLTVRMQIVSDGEGHSDFHLSRDQGHVLQFHSFYRDVRNQLAGANGWSKDAGRYHCNVQVP